MTGDPRKVALAKLPTDLRRVATTLVSALRAPNTEAFYRSRDAVDQYSRASALKPAERAIVDRLGKWLAGRSMLDVGIGGGRTTSHFAPLVATYVGVDYSPPMIAACEARFSGEMDNVAFAVEDVRNLSSFETGSVDFVLFSFNGIDCIGQDDRVKALGELHRVCAPSGFVCFSSHNIGFLPELFRVRLAPRTNVYHRARASLRLAVFRLLNPKRKVLAQARYAIVREPDSDFRSLIYYVRPSEQLAQLDRAGFSEVHVFGSDGRQVELAEIDAPTDMCLYYLVARSSQSPTIRFSGSAGHLRDAGS